MPLLIAFEYVGQKTLGVSKSWSTFVLVEGGGKNVMFSEEKMN